MKAEAPGSTAAWFEQQAAFRPSDVAIRTARGTATYEALNAAADRVARALLDQPLPPDAPVALLIGHGASALAAQIGALKAGRCYVPLDPANPRARIQHIIGDAGARLVLTDTEYRHRAEGLAGGGTAIIDIEQLPQDAAARYSYPPVAPETPACILYTSGSTGTPKGVVHSQQNLLHFVRSVVEGLNLSPADRLCNLYTSSVIGASRDTLAAVCSGAVACPYNPQERGLDGLAEWLVAERITVWQSVTTVLRHFLWTLRGTEHFPHLRILRVGGDPLTRQDVEAARRHVSSECAVVVYMGMTEVSPICQYVVKGDSPLSWDIAPAGFPLPGMDLLLVDKSRKEVPPGEVGEIAVRSQFISQGYWQRPELTSAVFVPPRRPGDPSLYFTGDLGRMAQDGCLEHLGRADAQVKVRGFRVELAEVENALMRIAGIVQTAVVARDDSGRGKRLVAYVVSGSPSPTVTALRRALRLDLPGYMVPQHFVFVDALPLTASGKVDWRALPVPEAGRPTGETEFLAPRDPLEAQLASIWEDVLDVMPVGILDDFFELGGDSLLSVHLVLQIEQSLRKSLPLAVLLEAPTIEKLASVIRDQNWSAPSSSLVALQAGTARPPFFCIHPVGGNVVGYRDLARALGPDQPVYGLQAQGLDDKGTPFTKLEAMAAHYVSEIRRLQPKGPYCLGGLSFGGLVAFEMAQQFQAQGHNVGMLALFDSSVPGSFRSVAERLLEHWAHARLLGPVEGGGYLAQRVRSAWRTITKRLWQARYKLELKAGRSWPGGRRSVSAANYFARQHYTPRPYAGRIILFRARGSKEIGVRDAEQKGWGRLALGGIEVWNVPGDHVTLIGEPHVQVLAKQLRACLDKAISER